MTTDGHGLTRKELLSRNRLALSLLNHREPSKELIDQVRLALEGASVQDFLDLDSDLLTKLGCPPNGGALS